MQADPVVTSDGDCSSPDEGEFGFEVPVMSPQSIDRATFAKLAIESHYELLLKNAQSDRERRLQLEEELAAQGASQAQISAALLVHARSEAEGRRLRRQKTSVSQFETIKLIGKGAFGEVRLCRDLKNGDLVALKVLDKNEMRRRNQIMNVRSERNLLASSESPWLTKLYCSFQDRDNLYFALEYLPGGDFMTLLQREDILTHNAAKFYTASLLLSLEVVHQLGYIHRDIKPDNLLIGSDGHLRLTDFGLCKPFDASSFLGTPPEDPSAATAQSSAAPGPSAAMKMTWNFKRRTLAYSSVGTPDYIAPEVLRKVGYGPEADLWGVGCVLFEMLCGFPPFFSDDAHTTCRKIVQWRSYLKFPSDVHVEPQAQSLIRQLLCDGADRLTIAGCKAHPFLADIPWADVHMLRPPFVPELKSEIDTCYFDDFDKPGACNVWCYRRCSGISLLMCLQEPFAANPSEHLPESVVLLPAAAAVKVLVLPYHHICGITARVYIIVGIPSFEPPPDLPADA